MTAASRVTLAKTAWRLGALNILRFVTYRLLATTGYYRYKLPIALAADSNAPFWTLGDPREAHVPARSATYWGITADRVLDGSLPVFSSTWANTGFPPDWHRSVLAPGAPATPRSHWVDGVASARGTGDIKGYWEASRFDGLLILALGWLTNPKGRFANGMSSWLADWIAANPANSGVNWLCGQETALRLLQTLLVFRLLERHSDAASGAGLGRFVEEHCRRIAPTLLYAVAQDNNHATSEAAALYIGGGWLQQHGLATAESERWQLTGRRLLEKRIHRLIMADGSFSQHSVNYHRLALDTLWMTEIWRRKFADSRFSDGWYERVRAAARWLYEMTNEESGDAPNLGANDGARLFVLHALPYRDFRPTVQMASVVLEGKRAYGPGPWDEPLEWLGVPIPDARGPFRRESGLFKDGGYATLVRGKAWAMMRIPRYRFRPSHADALHVDLWKGTRAILRDGGSYSYSAENEWMDYFPGTASHNTVQFDGRDQMPRVSRFLFGGWLECRELHFNAQMRSVTAAYRDHAGAYHRRTLAVPDENTCEVTDSLSGFSRSAVVRWRLSPGQWHLAGTTLQGAGIRLELATDAGISRSELVTGWESLHYDQKTPIPVWEVEIERAGEVKTRITHA